MHAVLLLIFLAAPPVDGPKIGPVPVRLRTQWRLSPFYKKYLDLKGFPVLSSDKVSDAAMGEAGYLIDQMLKGRDDVRRALIRNRVRFVVMSPKEMTTDVPEHSDLTPKDYWDRRARGLGATRYRPAVSCGEENLLNLRGDRYPRENILVHEFAHAIHEMGLNYVERGFDARVRACFNRAIKKGLWKGTYAATNHKEYWAEAVQSYFDCNNPPDRQHNDVNTRERLRRYDPEVWMLIDDAFRKTPWRYVRYDRRK